MIATAALSFTPHLVVRDADTGHIYAQWRVADGDRFAIEFIHSVNQTPVRDIFLIDSGELLPVETVFYGFGAGMQTELTAGQQLVHNPDGSLSIIGFTQRLPQLNYIVGTVSDHVLYRDDGTTSLRTLCGKNTAVTIKIEERIRLEFRK